MDAVRCIAVVCGLIGLALVLSPSMPCQDEKPTVAFVGGSGLGNFSTIQAAVDAVADHGTVVVYPGTYDEHLVLSAPISIRGGGREATIIDGGGEGYVVEIRADGITLEALGIRDSGRSFPQAGVVVRGDNASIHNVSLTGNFYGGYLSWGTTGALISGCIIEHNARCGIYFSHTSHNRIIGNRIGGHPANGCGLYDGSHDNLLANNTFWSNGYCGVNVRDCLDTIIRGNTFLDNRRGVHRPHPQWRTTLEQNTFQGNSINIEEEYPVSFRIGLYYVVVVVIVLLLFSVLRFGFPVRRVHKP